MQQLAGLKTGHCVADVVHLPPTVPAALPDANTFVGLAMFIWVLRRCVMPTEGVIRADGGTEQPHVRRVPSAFIARHIITAPAPFITPKNRIPGPASPHK